MCSTEIVISIQDSLLDDLARTNEGLTHTIARHRTQLAHERRNTMKKEVSWIAPHSSSSSSSSSSGGGLLHDHHHHHSIRIGSPPKLGASIWGIGGVSRSSANADSTTSPFSSPAGVAQRGANSSGTSTSSSALWSPEQRAKFTGALNSACWKGKVKTVEHLLQLAPTVYAGVSDSHSGNRNGHGSETGHGTGGSEATAASRAEGAGAAPNADHQADGAGQPKPAAAGWGGSSRDREEGRGAAMRAALNARDAHGHTALICAVQRDHSKIVALLLSHNAR